jgi:hypothetical protein
VYIECYLLTELLNSPSHYLSFQAYSLIVGYFCWTLCLVSAPKLWNYINSCIKTIQLYYEVNFVINVVLNSDWVSRSLYVSLGSHRYGTLEGNLAYVSVMDSGFGLWHERPVAFLYEAFICGMSISYFVQTDCIFATRRSNLASLKVWSNPLVVDTRSIAFKMTYIGFNMTYIINQIRVFDGNTFGKIELRPIRALKKMNVFKLLDF